MNHSLRVQIAEVEREIRTRKAVYPRQCARGKMRHGEAEELISIMQSVLYTLNAFDEYIGSNHERAPEAER